MRIIDLHCDTISRCLDENSNSLYDNNFHVDLKRGLEFNTWIQTFAFFVDTKYRGEDAWNRFLQQLKLFQKNQKLNKEKMSLVNDINTVKNHHCNYIFSVEGGELLNGNLSRLDFLKMLGVRIFTLVWNGEFDIGYGADTGVDKGLKPFGKQVLEKLNKLDIIPDVSHLNEAGFYDVAEFSTKPFIASHSNAKSVCNHFRNLSDEQIKVILDKKGLIGLNFHKPFLNEDIEKNTSISDILVHTEHFLSLGCENILSIGSDFDGANISEEIKDIKGLEKLYESMIKYFSKDIADKVFYKNTFSFLQDNI